MYTKQTSSMNNNAMNLSGVYDPLTELYSRPLFTQVANSLLRISLRQKMPVCLAMIQVDNYAELVDVYGLSEANDIIKECADLLKSISRDSDVLSHFDEDMFALLLYNCTYELSNIVVERINKHVSENLFIQNEPVKVNIGVAEFDERHARQGDNISEQLIDDSLRVLGII